MPEADLRAVSELLVRLTVSLLLDPEGQLDISDPAAVREYSRRYLARLVGGPDTAPRGRAGARSHRPGPLARYRIRVLIQMPAAVVHPRAAERVTARRSKGCSSGQQLLSEDDTDMVRKNPPEFVAAMAGATLLSRIAEPDEMVGTALLLRSDAGSFVTRQAFLVDGGTVVRRISIRNPHHHGPALITIPPRRRHRPEDEPLITSGCHIAQNSLVLWTFSTSPSPRRPDLACHIRRCVRKSASGGKEAVVTGPYRLIIRGPGDIGGRALRTALESLDFEVVGVSGKNAVSAASLQNPSMPTWLSALRSPLSRCGGRWRI